MLAAAAVQNGLDQTRKTVTTDVRHDRDGQNDDLAC
jgi:hypothetical protein